MLAALLQRDSGGNRPTDIIILNCHWHTTVTVVCLNNNCL